MPRHGQTPTLQPRDPRFARGFGPARPLRERLYVRPPLPASLATAVALLAGPALAHADGVDAQTLRLAPVGRGTLTIDGVEALGPLDAEGSALFSWATHPVELSNRQGDRQGGVLDVLGTLDLRVGLGLPAGFEASVFMPLILERRTPARFDAVGGAGVGDVGLGVRWSATPRGPEPIGTALLGSVRAPTGDEEALGGAGTLSGEIDAVVEARAGSIRGLLLAGARSATSTGRWHGAARGAELAWGSALEVAIDPAQHFRVSTEAAGFDAVVQRALERNPGGRFSSARDMREALVEAARGYVPSAPVPTRPPARGGSRTVTDFIERRPPGSFPRGRVLRATALAAALLGDAYLAVGNRTAAMAAYRRLLALDPNARDAATVRARLEGLGGS